MTTTNYSSFLQEFGLSPVEATIFEALIRYGELGVADIARRAGAHRRNVYDALQRLLEKGLVYEVMEQRYSRYQAVDPQKLIDLLDEKRERLQQVLPEFQRLYHATPSPESVLIYRGTEGLKNYMRDIIRTGHHYYSIGAKGIWADPRVKELLPSFLSEAKRKKIQFHILYDPMVREQGPQVLAALPVQYRFLPTNYKTPASLGVFGNTTVVLTDVSVGKMRDEISFTVITNAKLAESVRTWFHLLWEMCKPEKAKARE